MIRSLIRWGGLYTIVLLWIGGFYWEQNLTISQAAHDVLACAFLVLMGALVNIWIRHHAANFLAYRSEAEDDSLDKSGRRSMGNRPSEKN